MFSVQSVIGSCELGRDQQAYWFWCPRQRRHLKGTRDGWAWFREPAAGNPCCLLLKRQQWAGELCKWLVTDVQAYRQLKPGINFCGFNVAQIRSPSPSIYTFLLHPQLLASSTPSGTHSTGTFRLSITAVNWGPAAVPQGREDFRWWEICLKLWLRFCFLLLMFTCVTWA